jgi:hypothetical protein
VPEGPRLLATGPDAVARVAKVLPTAQEVTVPSNLGPVTLKPGTVWSGERMLIAATTMTVYYTIGDRLYEWGTGQFIRDEYLNALSAGAARALPMVHLAKAEIALLTGIFVPWYLMLGIGAAKLGFFYKNHQADVDEAFRLAPSVLKSLQELRIRHPALFNHLLKTAAREILVDLPRGITAEDVAFFLGRVIKGVGGLPEVTIGAVIKVAVVVAGIVTLTHLPGMAAHGVAAAARESGEKLRAKLAAEGIVVSEAEARAILRDLQSDKSAVPRLQQLEDSARKLAPVLMRLRDIIRTE